MIVIPCIYANEYFWKSKKYLSHYLFIQIWVNWFQIQDFQIIFAYSWAIFLMALCPSAFVYKIRIVIFTLNNYFEDYHVYKPPTE